MVLPARSTFSIIDALEIVAGSVVRLPDGRTQFALRAPGAAQVSVLGSSNLIDWQLLQSVPLTGGNGAFTDNSSSAAPEVFYRLRVP